MKDIKIINESTSITMYYGYNKYRDLFVQEINNIDTTIQKNILFIDIGYSKTSFILSNFKYNEFRVEYVLCDPYIGGRNFDELIYNYCINEFKKENKIKDSDITDKMKYRLIEEIKKKRIQLTVNEEINILVDSFYNEEDLEIILTKQTFENLIKNYLNKIENNLKSIIKY
jgi:molecular chaperone DnaK (HSP70)